MVENNTDYSDVFPDPNEETRSPSDVSDVDVPESYVAIVRDSVWGEAQVLAVRGVEVIVFEPDDIDPWDFDSVEEVDAASRKARQALALAKAGDHFEGFVREDVVFALEDVIENTFPAIREDIEMMAIEDDEEYFAAVEARHAGRFLDIDGMLGD